MSSRNNGYHVFCDINTTCNTMFINIREVVLQPFMIQMSTFEPYMIVAPYFHLVVNRSCYDIPWCKRSATIVPFHESLAGHIFQNRTISAQSFSDEKGRSFIRIVQ